MFRWLRCKTNRRKKETFSLDYVNKINIDLADYMSENQARRFCDALVGSSMVSGYFEKFLKDYKLWGDTNGRVVYGLQNSLKDYDEEIDVDAVISAIIRWAAGRPPHIKTEHVTQTY